MTASIYNTRAHKEDAPKPDKLAKLHKYFRKPDDPRYGRLDTLADELEKAGVPRGITILALSPFAFSKPHSAVNGERVNCCGKA